MKQSAEEQGNWYIIHTYSGQEERVKKNLLQRIETMDMRDRIFRVVVPVAEEIEIKEGKRTTAQRKLFPGYILVRMEMDDQSWYVVRNTPGVTGFVSAEDQHEKRPRPLPASEEEVDGILARMQSSAPMVKVKFVKDQSVRVVDGPFKEFLGVVDQVQEDKGKVRVLVTIFGRETPVELDFLQVEKM